MTSPRQEQVLDAAAGLHDLLNGYWRSQVLCTAARLGVADLLAGGPLTLVEMAAECGLSRSSLGRLMRALVGIGLCTVGEEGYRTTALGRAFESGATGGAHERALVTAEFFYPMWAHLADCLCRSSSAVDVRSGWSGVDLPGGPDGLSSLFERVAPDISEPEAKRIAATRELGERGVVVDVGGSSDALLGEILRAHPGIRGLLYDLPGGTDRARTSLADAGLASRTDVAEGDFLAEVPAGGDLYLLSFVLHSWDDEHALTLLRAVRTAMHPGARLLVIEELLPDDEQDGELASLHDLHMLVTTGGRERTEAEYVALLGAAGLAYVGTVETGGPTGVIEAYPA
ncbi:methyltransferase [Pseudonocardia endophytica]|uniref:Methyltransferase family protein n=1 Tax=Pseudonocardia endophytica TaxID=401976 RepID=A0A4R1HPG8_PSEEN|nr:methyltransferase [Pseudonocardia endophytica]TCK21639.1 methyltransferase family protein [Pseudonocardia endophytica]